MKDPPFAADDLAKNLQSDRDLSSHERCVRYIRACLEQMGESMFYTGEKDSMLSDVNLIPLDTHG